MSFGDTNVGAGVQNCGSGEYESETSQSTNIKIELKYEHNGEPVVGEEYLVTAPDGTEVSGFLDSNGFASVTGLICEEGEECDVTFPNMDEEAWDDG